MLIKKVSSWSQEINEREIPITQEQLMIFLNGTHAQHAFPHLSADDREFMITGMTPEEWAQLEAMEEEEEEKEYYAARAQAEKEKLEYELNHYDGDETDKIMY